MTEREGEQLLPIARSTIAASFGIELATNERAAWLHEPGASFVTLTRDGQLRGCIGSIEARQPLLADVKHNALAAAFHDPRFSPLTHREFDRIRIEVSLLSPLEQLTFHNEAHLLSQLRPGKDGLVLEFGAHRSTFLPQVWEQLPEPPDFIAQLKRKAGLPGQFWHPGLLVFRYHVDKWQETIAENA